MARKKTIAKKVTKKKSSNKLTGSEEKKEPKGKFQLLRGMKDVLPQEQDYWQYILGKVADFARIYGFERIDTPILESTDMFIRGTGKNTDIVEKEMFAFEDQGGEKMSLRPEFTPSIVRAYIEHGMVNLPQPVKLFTTGSVFRHAKPQAGRYRQFNQINFEVLGGSHSVIDAELIAIQYFLFQELGLKTVLHINSVGCSDCRPQYKQLLQDYYRNKKRNLCEDCKRRYTRSPLRLLDCKEESCKKIAEEAPQFVDHLCESCREHFVKVLEHLDTSEITYNLDPTIVRGLDYYTKTAFEFFPVFKEEEKVTSQGALSGGGRYGELVGNFGGRAEVEGSGFGIGIERLILALKEAGVDLPKPPAPDIFLAQLGDSARKESLRLLEDLRQEGFRIKANLIKDGLREQLGIANKLGVKITLILGQKEMLDKTILLRDMENGAQEVVDVKKLSQELKKRLAKMEEDV